MASQAEKQLRKNLAVDEAIKAATLQFADGDPDFVDPVQFHRELVRRGYVIMSL